MAKKTVVTHWYDAPLANGYAAWGVIVAVALALVLVVAKPGCKCGKHPHHGKPPAAKAAH